MIFLKFPLSLFILLSCFFIQANEPLSRTARRVLNEKLWEAIQAGNARDVDQAIDAGADPNASRRWGDEFIYYVDDPAILQVLVDNGADLNPQPGVYHPLHWRENPEAARIFVENGVIIDIRNQAELTPLHTARNLEMAIFFLENGANPNARDEKKRTPLHLHIDDFKIVEALLDHEADPNLKDKEGKTPLHKVEDMRIARLLLARGADPTIRDNDGNLPDVVEQMNRISAMQKVASPEGRQQMSIEAMEMRTRRDTSCRYVNGSSQMQVTHCGRRRICMGASIV